MAIMTNGDRADAWAALMRDSRAGVWGAITKTDLRAALNAADQWMSDNSIAYNLALPTAFRAAATSAQKALLLSYVLAKRFDAGV